MTYQIELTQQQAQPVLSIRTRTAVENLPRELGKAYGQIMQYLAELGEQPAFAPFAAYYNMDMKDLDVEMGFPVAKSLAGKGEIRQGEIPAGRQVSCFYKGPYAECTEAYDTVTKWMNENGCAPTGVCYEFYLNDPANTPESELLTKIVFPVK